MILFLHPQNLSNLLPELYFHQDSTRHLRPSQQSEAYCQLLENNLFNLKIEFENPFGMRFTNTLINTVCHIIIDGQAQEKFYLITHLIMLLQTISCIADPQSILFQLVRWADPSTYLDPAFSIVLCLVIIAVFTLLIVAKLIITEADEMLVKPNTLKIYMGNILLHMQMLCKTSVLAPLIRATILAIQVPANKGIMAAGIVGLTIYLLFLLPLSLYSTSNTFVLTPQLNKKLTYINIYLLLNLFRVPFAIFAPISQGFLIASATLFFIVFLSISIKQPIFAYSHQRPLKGMISAVAFSCLIRICQMFQGGAQQSILLQLVGMASFICFIDWIAQFRIRKILELPKPTVHQLKILMFLLSNIKEYFDKLEYFLMRHHRRCLNPQCSCSSVIAHISSKSSEVDEYSDGIWYRFLIDYIQQFYDLKEMEGLAQSEMRSRIEKYQYIVIDLAEMYLFKLGHVNEAYYIVNNYRHLLEARGISFLSFRQKRKIINYYLQENISIKYHTEGVINLNADSFMNFQVAFEKYKRTLLRSARSTAALWQEMGKRDPDGDKLTRLVHTLERWHSKIRKMYVDIASGFDKSVQILETLTNDYFENVLNIPAKSPFHVIEKPKFESLLVKADEKVEKISENMQAFSFNSETPMCFVSVDEERFGQIVGSNSHFNRVMSLEFGRVAKIDEFMVPEMKRSHQIRMKEFIRGDVFNLQHKNGFTLNLRGKIIYTKILVQIMPSIEEGLRYVFFLKKLMPRKKVLGLRNGQAIGYTSQSFDESFEGRGRRDMILRILQEERLASLRESHQIKIEFQQREVFLRWMHQFSDGEANWMFIEFYEQEDVLLQTKYNLLGERTSAIKKTSTEARTRKDSVISKQSNSMERSNMEKSDLQEKLAVQKLKKTEQAIRNAYQIIIDDRKKNMSTRIIILTVVMVLLLLGALLASVLVKLNHQDLSIQTIKVNTAFHTFLLSLTNEIVDMKKLNVNQFINNSMMASIFYTNVISNVNITTAMDNLVVNFEIGSITQTWNTLTCNTTSRDFIVGTENNFLTVSDFIQNPITNLVANSITAFKFPPYLSGQSLPLSSISCLFFQLILNSIYITIPGFLSLKASVMDDILQHNLGVSLPMIFIFLSIFLISALYVIGKVVLNIRVTRLKNNTYILFESLGRELIEEKEKNCKEFITKYTLINSGEADDGQIFSDHSGSFRTDADLNISGVSRNNFDKTVEEETQRELQVNSQLGPQTKTSNFIQNSQKGAVASRIKSKPIFSKSSMHWIGLKYGLLALPFLLYSFVFGGLQIAQARQLSNALKVQSQLQVMQQNLHLITLYGMQHGTEGNKYPQLLNLPAFLYKLKSQIYEIQRNFVSNAYDISALPQLNSYLSQVAYNNLCSMNLSIPKNIAINCTKFSNSVLTKGLYSSLISFLQQLSTILLANPDTSNYTNTQRINYLNQLFFTSHGIIILYFDAIFSQFLSLFGSDFTNLIQKSANVLIFANVGIILGVGLVGFLLERHYIQKIKKQILQIKSLFLLISFESIMKDEALKTNFYERIQAFKKLK